MSAKTTATGRLSLWSGRAVRAVMDWTIVQAERECVCVRRCWSGRAVRAVMDWTIVQAERVCVCQEVLECNRIQTE